MTQHEARRGFIVGGTIAHLVSDKALCGARPWPADWCFHVDAAKELPLCVDCLHTATRPKRKRR